MIRRMKAPRGKPESMVSREVLQALRCFASSVEIERQNTGGCYNASGQYVSFSTPGAADFTGIIRSGPRKGCRFELEIKRGDFDPRRCRGATRERFRRQLARLKRTCANGGVGLWINDASQLLHALPRILAGAGIVYDDDGYPYLDRG